LLFNTEIVGNKKPRPTFLFLNGLILNSSIILFIGFSFVFNKRTMHFVA
jgi:hypothetical protein